MVEKRNTGKPIKIITTTMPSPFRKGWLAGAFGLSSKVGIARILNSKLEVGVVGRRINAITATVDGQLGGVAIQVLERKSVWEGEDTDGVVTYPSVIPGYQLR
jgi:hypothetical protein